MCGIAGILNYTGQNFEIREYDLSRMAGAVGHRGPDGQGVWRSGEREAGFGHTRLAIVDLSPLGAQPMHSQCGRYHITYNGEIYNHIALRHRLQHLGHKFVGRSDTETLMHALMQWGTDALPKLEGMFAFCFYDEKERRALLVRDRIGVKPLYYAFRSGICYFASEIKALVTQQAITPEMDATACYHYLTFLTTPAPMTMFRGIGKIPAGHYMEIRFADENRQAKISGHQWWDAIVQRPGKAEYEKYSDEEWVKGEIRRLLAEAVEKQMMSDVPYGVFLSGGIDSSTIVALMDAFMDQPVRTFTVGFKDHPDYNELEYARKIRDIFKTDHREILIDTDDMLGYLDQLVVSQDEPIADWVCVPLYFVSKLVRDSGTIVVQVGEGSDEQFCGYEGYMEQLRWKKKYWDPLMQMPHFMRAAAYGGASLVRMFDESWRGRKEHAYRAWKDRELFWGGAVCYPEMFKQEIIIDRGNWIKRASDEIVGDPVGWMPSGFGNLDSYDVVREYYSKIDREKPDRDYLDRISYLEFKLRLAELLLMRVDKITMSTSIEARVPFLDHKLVEFTMNIPMSMKIKYDVPKYILKESVRGLIPDEIIDRKKMGFDAPIREWLRGDFGDKVIDTFKSTKLRDERLINFDKGIGILNSHRNNNANIEYPVWSLFNLALWYDRWIARSGEAGQ